MHFLSIINFNSHCIIQLIKNYSFTSIILYSCREREVVQAVISLQIKVFGLGFFFFFSLTGANVWIAINLLARGFALHPPPGWVMFSPRLLGRWDPPSSSPTRQGEVNRGRLSPRCGPGRVYRSRKQLQLLRETRLSSTSPHRLNQPSKCNGSDKRTHLERLDVKTPDRELDRRGFQV